MAGASARLTAAREPEALAASLVEAGRATVVAVGPWLFTMAALVLIALLSAPYTPRPVLADFRVLLIYAFAISLVAASPIVMVANRVLADALYLGERGIVPSLFASCLAAGAIASAALALIVSVAFTVPAAPAIALVQASGVIGMLWITLAFAGTLRDIRAITLTFLAGLAVAIAGTVAASSARLPAAAMLLAFSTGPALIFAALASRVLAHAPEASAPLSAGFQRLVQALTRYRAIAAGALIATVAVWIDKWVMWKSPLGEHVASGLIHAPAYDSATFIAYLTIIPAIARFIRALEADYIPRYRAYFAAIEQHATLAEIEAKGRALEARTLTLVEEIFLGQAVICAVVVFTAPQIIGVAHLHYGATGILRLAAIGALFQFLFLAATSLLLFFERYREFFALEAGFLALNLAATLATLAAGPPTYGYGVLAASVVSGVAAFVVLAGVMKRLGEHTFVGGAVRAARDKAASATHIPRDPAWMPLLPNTPADDKGTGRMIRLSRLTRPPRVSTACAAGLAALALSAVLPNLTQAGSPAEPAASAPRRAIADAAEAPTLAPGDRIKVTVFELIEVPGAAATDKKPAEAPLRSFYQRLDLSGEYTLELDGRLTIPRLGTFEAGNKPIADIQAAIGESYERTMGRDCDITIAVLDRQPVYVLGAARTPGAYKFVPGMVVMHVLSLAGGLEKSPERATRAVDILREKERSDAATGKLKRLLADRARIEADANGRNAVEAPLRLIELAGEAETTLYMKAETTLLEDARRAYAEETRQAADAEAAVQREIEALDTRLKNGEELIELRRQRVEELEELAGRGVINGPSLTIAKTDLVEAQGRREEMTVARATAGQRLEQAQRARERLVRDREGRLARERAALDDEIRDTERALQGIARVADAMAAQTGPGAALNPTLADLDIEIVRRTAAGATTLEASEMTALAPGDIVRLKPADPARRHENTAGTAGAPATLN